MTVQKTPNKPQFFVVHVVLPYRLAQVAVRGINRTCNVSSCTPCTPPPTPLKSPDTTPKMKRTVTPLLVPDDLFTPNQKQKVIAEFVNELPLRSEYFKRRCRSGFGELSFTFFLSSKNLLKHIVTTKCEHGRFFQFCPKKALMEDTNGLMVLRFTCDAEETCIVDLPVISHPSIKKNVQRSDSHEAALVLLAVLNGRTWSQFETSSLEPMPEHRFTKLQGQFYSVTTDYFHRSTAQLRQLTASQCMERGEKGIRLSIDGAWATRGWNARQFTLIVRDIDSDKVFYAAVLTKDIKRRWKGQQKILHQGSYQGTSRGMEAEATRHFVQKMEAEGVLEHISLIVVDGDQSTPKILKEAQQRHNFTIAADPGHMKKNFQKRLVQIFTRKNYKTYAYRIATLWIRLVVFLCRQHPGTSHLDYENRRDDFHRM